MSRNNKSATRMARARELALAHKNGSKGPARTQPLHGKRNKQAAGTPQRAPSGQ